MRPLKLPAAMPSKPQAAAALARLALPAPAWLARVAATALCLAATQPVWAQTAGVASTVQSPVFAIAGFKVMGENPLADGETARVLAPFLRADATLNTLQNAVVALEAALREQGYGLYRVSLPPQEVAGTIALQITSFKIGKVQLINDTPYSTANVRHALPELREGSTLDIARLSVQNALANESFRRRLGLVMRESETPGEIDATITVKGDRPWAIGAAISSSGSRETGRDRTTLVASHGNLWDRDHALDLAYTTSLDAPSAVRQLGATYKVPLYFLGGVVSAGLSSSTVKGDFGTFTTNGAGTSLGLGYLQHMGANGGWRHFVQVRVDDKLSKATAVNGLAIGVDRRSRPITLGYLLKGEADSKALSFGVDYSINVPQGAGNNDVSYQLEDPQRPLKARWSKLRLDASVAMALPAQWQMLWRAQAQYANAPLISSEQLASGGAWLRGAGSVFGDRGFLSALDIYSPEITPGLRGLLFFDLGSLSNNNGTLSRPSSDWLSSAGIGLRYSHASGWYALADYAQVIKGSTVPLAVNSSAPQRGNSSLSVTVGARY